MLRTSATIVLTLLLTGNLLASPARLITAGPVAKTGIPQTGPFNDPLATQGQWFLDPGTNTVESRPWEFHDNNDVFGAIGSQAIRGNVTNIQLGPAPQNNILGFNIVASITNDLPGIQGPGQPGRNTHLEVLSGSPNYQGTMFDVKMTAEFAFPSRVTVPAGTLAQIAAGTLPYTTPSYGGQAAAIIAQNEDQEGWYCYSSTATGTGGFHVPTFDFGNIAPGQTVTRTLGFTFSGTGLSPGHPLYPQLLGWQANSLDVLMNRTTDLKIGDWVDVLAQDTGLPYPIPALTSGNVSVFFNVPEPTTFAVLAPMALAMLRRRNAR